MISECLEIFKCSPEELFLNIQIHHTITVVPVLFKKHLNYTILRYSFPGFPLPPLIFGNLQHLSKQISTWGSRNIFFMKSSKCVSIGQKLWNLIYWFVFFCFRPKRQKPLKEFSVCIASASCKICKTHSNSARKRVTNYDMYLHMFNHIYLISFCYFCRGPLLHGGGSLALWVLWVLRKVPLSEHSTAALVSFCVIFSNEIWNLQFLNDVCEIIWLY